MDTLKAVIQDADEQKVRNALNAVLKDLGYGELEILSLKLGLSQGHDQEEPCLPPNRRVCYWDLSTGKRICRCI